MLRRTGNAIFKWLLNHNVHTYSSCTSTILSLASQPYFSACACALWRGEGEGTSGDYCTVFVSNGNVISAFGHAIIT